MPQQNILITFLRLLARLWIIVTAVIGSFFVLIIALLILVATHSSTGITQSAKISQKVIEQHGPDKVAIVNLSGEIVEAEGSGPFANPADVISARRTIQVLDQIDKDDDVKAVVLRIDSPGGAVVASDEIYQRVKQLSAKKPVVVSMGDATASGGYYISVGANKIVANPATLTGSIGVIAELPQLSGLYNKLGVNMRVIKSGKFKDIGSPNRDMTPEEEAIFNSIITDSYNQFVKAVATGRHMDEAKVRELADGRVYSGLQAQANGLVDELGNQDTAIKDAQDLAKISDATLVEYSNQNFLEALFQSKLADVTGLSALSQVSSQVSSLIPAQKVGVYYMMQ